MENSQRLSKKDVTSRLKEMYKKLFNQIDNEIYKVWADMGEDVSYQTLMQLDRYKKLKDFILKSINNIGQSQVELMQSTLVDVFMDTVLAFEKFIGSDMESNAPHENMGVNNIQYIYTKETAESIVSQNYKSANFSDRIWKNMDKLRENIENSVMQSAIKGTDVRNVARELKAIMGVGYSQSKRIVITETSRVFNEACRTQAIEKGFKRYRIHNEKNACIDCKDKGGKDKLYNLSRQMLPIHPYCKCTMLVDIDEYLN